MELNETINSLTFGVELELKLEATTGTISAMNLIANTFCNQTNGRFVEERMHSGMALKITRGRLKGWTICKDGSVTGGCEVVSPVLTADTLRSDVPYVCELLAGLGAYADSACGFHIHVGRANRGSDYDGQFSPSCIKNIVAMFEANYNLLYGTCKPSGRNPREWAGSVVPELLNYLMTTPASKLSLAKMKDAFYHGTQPSYYYSGRYAAVNLHSLWYEGRSSTHTLEFRLFNGTVDADEIVGRCLFIGALIHQADTQKTCSFSPKQTDNPKFSMRTWLTRIGLNGPEYKIVRDVMTRNLAGCSAWRSGVNGKTLAEVANA